MFRDRCTLIELVTAFSQWQFLEDVVGSTSKTMIFGKNRGLNDQPSTVAFSNHSAFSFGAYVLKCNFKVSGLKFLK